MTASSNCLNFIDRVMGMAQSARGAPNVELTNSAAICSPPALTSAHPVMAPLPSMVKAPVIDTGA